MTNHVHAEIVDPHAMSRDAREAFTDELFVAHCAIFSGVDRPTFAKYVVDSPAERTRIQVFRAEGRIVGYAAYHVFEREVDGQPCLVVRGEVGLMPAYRRGTRFGTFFLRETLRVLRTRRGRPVWGLSCATNPATYRTLYRHNDQVWPCPDRATPRPLQGLMDTLAEQFGLVPVEGAHPGVFHVGWKTRQDEAETRQWEHCEEPASRLYVERNPGYTKGHGMLILIPVTTTGMIRAGLRLTLTQLRRRFRRWTHSLPAAPSRPSISSPSVVAEG